MPLIKVPTTQQEALLKSLREKLAAAESRLKGPLAEVDAEQILWEKDPGTRTTKWQAVKPVKLAAKNGATLKADNDHLIVVDGENAATETYTVTFSSDLAKLSALRLDVFPDDRFPGNGPGRSSNGNFVMTGIQIRLGDGAPLKLAKATADYSQADGNFDVNSLVTGGKGWAIHPNVGKPHHAVFELAEPLAAGKREITVQLQFDSQFAQHQFARFRLSATDSGTPHEISGKPATIPANVDAALKVDAAKRTEPQKKAIADYFRLNVSKVYRTRNQSVIAMKKEIADAEKAIPDAMVMQEMAKPRDTFVLVRGAYDKKGEKVTMGTPEALPPMAKDLPVNRLGLAKWLMSAENPLTARVTVNRYWQMFFGTGLVKTTEDFGTQGEYPTHHDLLDVLAVDFRESGWDMKKLVTRIVTSQAYRQSAVVSKDLVAKDPENRLLARGPRFRLQAEFIRDQALAVSGLLNGEVGGKSVSPYQPPGLWEELMSRSDGANWTAQTYVQSKGKDLYRRTMYTFWKRTCPPASLATLDAPDRETCVVRRSRTNTPLQALVLMNDPTYVEASRKLAERLLAEGGPSVESKIAYAFKLAASRMPNERETAILKKLYDDRLTHFTANPAAAKKLLAVGESPADAKLDPATIAAWATVAGAILNLDEVLTRG
jgi:Protein of unknown function (DUF1553)